MKKHIPIICTFVVGAMVGAMCLWITLRPATRAMASWMHIGFITEPVEVSLGTDTGVTEHPLLQLMKTSTGTEWKLVMMGKEAATSREQILPLFARLAEYDPSLTVFIIADPEVDMATLKDCITSIKQQGLSHFWIRDILRGSSNVEIIGGQP